jgi:hypothetical protein
MPREKAGFSDAEKKSQDVVHRPAVHEHHCRRDDSPCHQDARDPNACTDPFEDEIARYFEDEIATEENPGAESEDLGSNEGDQASRDC